jgi:hypothetical protein
MWQSTQLLDDIAGSSRHLSGDFMFRHSITRRLGFHAGYGRSVSTSDLPGSSKFVHDNFDFGLDYAYDGSLKLGPRTTATFGTATGVASNGQDYRFRLNGHAGITRGIGRTWGASAYYIRDSGFEAGFADFVFTDSLTGSFSGLITERLSFNSGVYWTRGEVGFDGDSYTNMSATSSLSYGLFTNVGAYAQYTYQNSEYPAGSTVFLLPGRMNRQSVSAGLSAWLPLIKTRRGRP